MYKLNNINVNSLTLGSLLILSSTIVKSSISQMKDITLNKDMINIMCLITFCVGWIITAYSLSMNDEGFMNIGENKTLFIFLLSFIIGLSFLAMNKYINVFNIDSDIFKISFILGWILLGYINGIDKKPTNLTISILSSIIILVGQMIVKPFEMSHLIFDGASNVVILLGWIGIIFSNALRV